MTADRVFSFRRAEVSDVPRLLPLVREFHRGFGFEWEESAKEALLLRFAATPFLGKIWIAESGAAIAGYGLVVVYFSLEFGGPTGLLDELFVSEHFRGGGVGRRLVETALGALASEGISFLRLEVDRKHPEAAGLYSKLGFIEDGREVWTKRVRSHAASTGAPALE
ncbi:MAG: GNAT family N-acetyltransferase [Verrucomicrobiales bacterium]|nr:GNAT family N-acetyltransferase [Verrucomicrobiales bacterium]